MVASGLELVPVPSYSPELEHGHPFAVGPTEQDRARLAFVLDSRPECSLRSRRSLMELFLRAHLRPFLKGCRDSDLGEEMESLLTGSALDSGFGTLRS